MKKQKVKLIVHQLNDVLEFGNIIYRVAYINHGTAFLSPMDDYPGTLLYYCCAAIKLDQYGNFTAL